MLYKGSVKSNKTKFLAQKYAELINSGVNSDNILVLCQNSEKKKIFTDYAKEFLSAPCYGFKIFSFFGLARYFIEENWPIIENSIKDENAVVMPNLGGLEISRYIFKNCIENVKFKGYNSKNNLLHQMFRRYSLICQNALTQEDVENRVKILKESFSNDAQAAISLYRNKTLELRSFDYLRQSEAFSFLYKKLKNNFKYVFVDDGDELSPAATEYLKYIKDDVKEFYVFYDDKGASREGYLAAANEDFEKLLNEKAQKIDEDTTLEDRLFYSIKNEEKFEDEKIILKDFIGRDAMIKDVIDKINELLKNGVKLSEISIIMPETDSIIKFYLSKINKKIYYLTGSEKLSNNSLVNCFLMILKSINSLNVSFSSKPVRKIMSDVLKIDFKTSNTICDLCVKNGSFVHYDNKKYLKFLSVLNDIKAEKLSNQLYILCDKFIELKEENQKDILKLNELMKQITDFEDVLGDDTAKKYLLEALDYTIISENPIRSEEIDKDSIVAGTAQKIIDSEVKTKYQFLLDGSCENWIKQDTGPLYNSWVFRKKWDKKDFTYEDNKAFMLDKTARILRKLFLLNEDKIYIYSSNYNFRGQENTGGISKFFKSEQKNTKKPKNIIPRDDQKPVLEYNGGKMGVNAVAGSGKTTIMLALLVKLLNQGVEPQNIFVLTFMDSAAKNFKEKIKENFPNLIELPHISTIHGLALRIIKENSNYRYLDLSENFEIIDEVRTQNIMSEILEGESSRAKTYIKAIENFKLEEGKTFKSLNFKRVYEAYQNYLKENSLLDYNDLLIYALKLLRENKEIREYYGKLARYILEDEAQDSNCIQQKIIEILSKKWENVVRVGDVNQSIMTTFSNSDVKGFKNFVENSNYVNMNRSQRCSKGVYTLANKLIKYAKNKNIDAFIDVEMLPVEGKNPKDDIEVKCEVFNEENEETKYIISEIGKIFTKNPNSTAGLLLRTNYEVNVWADILNAHKIKTKVFSDNLGENPVFKVVLACLKFIEDTTNENAVECSKALFECGIYNDFCEFKEKVQKIKTPFLNSELEDFPLWWDLREFVSNSKKDIVELSMMIGEYYFSNSPHNVNISLVSGIVEDVNKKEKSSLGAVHKLEKMKNNKRETKKFFDIEKNRKGTVEIMTIHKSKGDEFDYVFIPKMSKENFPLDMNIKIKRESDFIFTENVKKIPKTLFDMKKEAAEENYRLLYVGITRAKKRIYLTTSKKYKIFHKMTEIAPCDFISEVLK